MRLTRETLIKIARDTATQRTRVSRRLVCICLTGSLLGEDPLLGGTTDIDLIIIHDSEPIQEREIVRISDEIHLDIAHFDQSVFHQPRHLRTEPWLGSLIYNKPMVLHDTQHWFEFTQAATGAQFTQPDYTLQRARKLAESARQTWMDLQFNGEGSSLVQVKRYLQALVDAGNAVACLSGMPLPERRFFLNFPYCVRQVDRPELAERMVQLITNPDDAYYPHWAEWLTNWKNAFIAAGQQENAPARLHPSRLHYYERAANAMAAEQPAAALWMMLQTWALAATELPEDAPEQAGWTAARQILSLDEDHFDKRLEALDQYLDMVEETLDLWAQANGVSALEQ